MVEKMNKQGRVLASIFMFVNIAFTSSTRNLPENASFINFSIEPENTVVAVSKPFILNCEVKRYSNTSVRDNSLLSANISWFKNGQAIVFGRILSRKTFLRNGSLQVSSVQSSDSGLYECKASYNHNVLLSRKAQVRVAVFPLSPSRTISISSCKSSTILLNCSFNAVPTPVVTWYKNEKPIGSRSSGSFSGTSEYNVLSTGSLEVSTLKPSVAGTYYCSGRNAAARRTGNRYILSVTNCPKSSDASFLAKPRSTSVLAGQTAFLDCSITGISNGQIKWMKNATEIDFQASSRYHLVGSANLMIENVQFEDENQYSCILESSGTPLIASAKLTVLEPPRLLNRPNRLHLIHYGCQVTLLCNVTGAPKPTVTWYKNGQPLMETKDVVIKKHVLIKTVRKFDDAGSYQCIASNDAGNLQVAFQLIYAQQDLPVAESLSNDTIYLESLTNSAADLIWSPFAIVNPSGYTIHVEDTTTGRQSTYETSGTKFTLKHLVGNHVMRVFVTPHTSFCSGVSSKAITFTVPNMDNDVKDIVQNFAVEPSPSGVQITWSPPANRRPSDALLYKVMATKMESEDHDTKSQVTAQTSYEFLDLQPYTSYSFQVALVKPDDRLGPFTQPIITKTPESSPSRPPGDVRVTVESADEASVTWTPPPSRSINGQPLGYVLRYKDLSTGKVKTQQADSDATGYTLTGLRRNTRYWLRIQIYNNADSGPFSKKVNFETSRKDIQQELSRPGRPRFLEAKRSAREIILMWEPPEEDVHVREYVIGWGESGPYDQTDQVSEDRFFYRIEGLEPYTQYFVSVRARNRAGMGEEYHTELWTLAVDDKPDELYPPLGVHVNALTHTTLNVSWHDTDKNQDFRYYSVRIKTNVPGLPRVRYVNASDVSCIIHGLRPHTVYEIAVQVRQKGRKSAWSMTETAITNESKPGTAPTDLTVMAIEDKPTFVQLNWHPPVEPNGELNGYLIFYTTDQHLDISNWVLEPVVGDKLSTSIEGLTEDTQYYFKAQARNRQGMGPYSEVVAYRTPNVETVSQDKPSKNMPNWMWYVIIGAVGVLIISIVIVSTIMICRNRKAKRSPKRRVNGSSRHLPSSNGVRSTSGESWPFSAHSAQSATSMKLLRPEEQHFELRSLNNGDGRYLSDYPNYRSQATPAELAPLNGNAYMTNYPYTSSHPCDVVRSPLGSENCQCYGVKGQYGNGKPVRASNLHRSTCDIQQYEVDYRYPNTNLPSNSQDYAVDSAYGSDNQHHRVPDTQPNARSGKPKYKTSYKDEHSSSDRSSPLSDSLPRSQDSNMTVSAESFHLGNVTDFLRTMKQSEEVSSAQ